MLTFLKKAIPCAAAFSFVVVAVLGEGLHLLPPFDGYHHAVCQHDCAVSHANHDDADHHLPRGDSSTLDRATTYAPCPICRLLAQVKSAAADVASLLAEDRVFELPAAVPSLVAIFSPRSFDARAPPLAV